MKSKIIMAVVSLVIALGLWAYVITAISPGSEVVIEGVPVNAPVNGTSLQSRNLVITDYLDRTVDLHLAGNRSDLIKLNNSNLSVTIDESKVDSTKTSQASYTINYPLDVSGDLFSDLGGSPNAIRIVVEERISADITVKVETNGTKPAEGFEAQKPVTDYVQIPVSGPRSVVENIDRAEVTVDLTDLKTPIEELSLEPVYYNKDGSTTDMSLVKRNVNAVKVNIPILCVKQIPVLYEVIEGMGVTQEDVTIHVNPQSVKVLGYEADVAPLENITLKTPIDLSAIMEEEYTFTEKVSLNPDIIIEMTGSSELEVTVTVDMDNVKTKRINIPVANITYENIPEGLEIQHLQGSVGVTLRGSAQLIDVIGVTDIKLKVDLTGAKEGERTCEIQLELSKDYAQLGILEVGTVRMSLNQIQVEDEPDAHELTAQAA